MREWLARMARWSGRRWTAVAAAASGAVGALLAVVGAGLASPGWRLPAAVAAGALGAGGTAWAVFVLYRHLREREEREELRALVNVRPLTRELPLDLGGWAADPVFADTVVRRILRRRPRRVVECGSGWTTVLIAACLRKLGAGRVVALEHEERFGNRTRALLAAAGCGDRAEVVDAPLASHHLEGEEYPWYSLDRTERLEGPIDVLVVDGPPKSVGAFARYPAVPVLRGRLDDDYVILLDDGFRTDEARIARAWGRNQGVEPELLARGRGIWALESRGQVAPDHRDASVGSGVRTVP